MKNTWKTVLCLMMALLLVFGMSACTKNEEPAEEPVEEQTEAFSADEMVGTWADKTAGRATIEISPAEDGRYAIHINWGNTAFETYVWDMTAVATEENVLYYEDCTHVIVTLPEAEGGEEKIEEVYTGGHGQFVLLSTNEIQWTDDIENAAEDLLFISAK
ncbi:MAG: hypothetical protein J6A42_08675 [Firmicutes bacterium]|nr:hypothetical protein [Bacillota bacterium]